MFLVWTSLAAGPETSLPTLSKTQYFAQIAIGGGSITAFVIQNPNPDRIKVRVELHSSTGEVLEARKESLAAGETRRLDFAGEGGESIAGWAELRSSAEFVAVELVQYSTSLWVSLAASTPVTAFKVLGKVDTPNRRTGVAIANPDPLASAEVTAVLRDQEGKEVRRMNFILGPMDHRSG